ncbi:MAG: IclR family transcriptional regulator [Acidobacteria bacterium]|nr:MAG: IclR family transcriptional regulator [Acidobacteriota bacterium]
MSEIFQKQDGGLQIPPELPIHQMCRETKAINLRTQSVRALERGFAILEELARSQNGMTVSELARKLALPKSTAHCLLLTLERCGYLHRNEQEGRFMFGLKLVSLGNMALSRIRLRQQALPYLNALMQKTRLTVHMAILEQNEAVLVEKLEAPDPTKISTWVGKRMDAHCTAVGKAIIAHLTESELDRLIQEHGLPRHNDYTIASSKKLRDQLAQVRRVGYSLDDEEDEIGFRAIGAPLFDSSRKVVGSISVCGTTEQIVPENESFLSEKVKETAAAISGQLDFDVTLL